MWEPDYISLVEYKDYMNIDDNNDDAEIQLAITGASRSADFFCSNRRNGLGARRQFGKVDSSEARYYTPRWDTDLMRWVVEIDDLWDASDVELVVDTSNNGTFSETITDFYLRDRNAPQRNRPYTQIAVNPQSSSQPSDFVDSARVTTDGWGWASVPVTVKTAVMIQANRYNKRRDAPFGVAGSPNAVSAASAEQSILDRLDPDIELMLTPYIKMGWTV